MHHLDRARTVVLSLLVAGTLGVTLGAGSAAARPLPDRPARPAAAPVRAATAFPTARSGVAHRPLRAFRTGSTRGSTKTTGRKPRPTPSPTATPTASPAPTSTLTASPTPTSSPTATPTSSAAPLAVRVSGSALVNGAGRPLRLLGVNRSGTEFACAQGWGFFDGPTDTAAVAAMAAWHVNAVRVPLNEDCWLGINGVSSTWGGQAYRDAVVQWVGRLHQAGLLAVLDLHWSAPGTTLATSQQVMADADHSPAFWSSVATTFRSDPAVVFDLYNEPHDISWTCWRDGCTTAAGWQAAGMQSLVDAVRGSGATQPVLVGGVGWASDLSGWLAHRPTDPAGQLAASAHIYSFSGCSTASCWDSTLAPVAAQVPLVTGEVGENDCATAFTTSYLDWADAHGVSYLGWTWNTWDCASGPALISSYDGTPTAFGAALRDRLARVSS